MVCDKDVKTSQKKSTWCSTNKYLGQAPLNAAFLNYFVFFIFYRFKSTQHAISQTATFHLPKNIWITEADGNTHNN